MPKDEPSVDPLTDLWHYEIPDLTEWELEKVLAGLGKLEAAAGLKALVQKLEHSERRPGHPRPLASLPWEKAAQRGCSDVDLFFDLTGD